MEPGLHDSASTRPADFAGVSQPLLVLTEEADENTQPAQLGRANPDPGLTPTGGTR